MGDTVNFTRQTSENLVCVLSDDEQRDRGRQLAEAVEAVTNEQVTQKAAKDEMKDRLDEMQAERTRLAVIVREGKEKRLVPVRFDYDDALGKVHKTRLDTGEVYESRAMTDEERQRALPFARAAVN